MTRPQTRLDLQPVRYNIDAWDEMMMDRDKRLTGHIRGQKVRPTPFLLFCSREPCFWMTNDVILFPVGSYFTRGFRHQ